MNSDGRSPASSQAQIRMEVSIGVWELTSWKKDHSETYATYCKFIESGAMPGIALPAHPSGHAVHHISLKH